MLEKRFGDHAGVTGSHSLVSQFPMRGFDNRGDDYALPVFPADDAKWLAGAKVLFLYSDGFEAPEGLVPGYYLEERGAKVTTASANWRHQYRSPAGAIVIGEWSNGDRMLPATDLPFSQVNVADYDVVYWPGGAWCPDDLRMDFDAKRIIREARHLGLIVATICHGGWVLCGASCPAPDGQPEFPSAGVHVTGVESIQEDLRRYGFTVDAGDVVYDANANILTGTGPKVLGPYCQRLGELLKQKLSARA